MHKIIRHRRIGLAPHYERAQISSLISSPIQMPERSVRRTVSSSGVLNRTPRSLPVKDRSSSMDQYLVHFGSMVNSIWYIFGFKLAIVTTHGGGCGVWESE